MAAAYKFTVRDKGGYWVKRGRKDLGFIVPSREPTGRHCFYLGFDKRRNKRTYRGKVKAAEALDAIDRFKQLIKKHGPEQALCISFDERPRSSDQW